MADSSVPITSGTGTNIDTRTESVNGDHRQVVVIGDPATGTGVAPVDAVNGLGVKIIPALPAGDNNIGNVDIVTLPVLPAGTNNIGDVDVLTLPALPTGANVIGSIANVATIGTSVTPGTGATHLGKAEDAAHASGDTGVMPLAVRRDANTALVSSDGDYAPLQVDASGSLKVNITAGAGSGGTSIADEAAFTEGSTSVTPAAGYYLSSEDTLTSGKIAAIGIDAARNVKTHEQYAPLAEDNNNGVIANMIRPVYGATYAAPYYMTSFGTSVAISGKPSAGNLLSIYASNINAAVRYLQVHNKASAPAATNVPVLSLPIPAGSATVPGSIKLGREMFGEGGKYLSTGVAIGISTTEATYTAATATDHDIYGEAV